MQELFLALLLTHFTCELVNVLFGTKREKTPTWLANLTRLWQTCTANYTVNELTWQTVQHQKTAPCPHSSSVPQNNIPLLADLTLQNINTSELANYQYLGLLVFISLDNFNKLSSNTLTKAVKWMVLTRVVIVVDPVSILIKRQKNVCHNQLH